MSLIIIHDCDCGENHQAADLDELDEICPAYISRGASPDTLIVEKVDGTWPEWALDAAEHWETFTAEDGERSLRTKPPCDVLDALLAQQGTTK